MYISMIKITHLKCKWRKINLLKTKICFTNVSRLRNLLVKKLHKVTKMQIETKKISNFKNILLIELH